MRLGAFHCGGDVSPRAFVDPFDDEPGKVEYFPYMFFLVEHSQGRVLYDTGLNPKWFRDDATLSSMSLRVQPDDGVVDRLASAGLAPGDVDHVVAGHLHFDHAGGLRSFKHANVYVHPDELEFATSPAVYQADFYDPDDFEHDLSWIPVADGYDLFGDGKVRILHTPGHTPGHCSLLVELASGPHVLVGDVSYLSSKMRSRRLSAVVWSPDAAVRSWERLERLEAEHDAALLFTHDQDFRQNKKLAPEDWYV